MALQSQLFRGDPKLDAAAVSDPAHILQGARGPHVEKIQTALNILDSAALEVDGIYGPATATAVFNYKTKRDIVNRSYQKSADNIVGKMTMAKLDEQMLAHERKPPVRITITPISPVRNRDRAFPSLHFQMAASRSLVAANSSVAARNALISPSVFGLVTLPVFGIDSVTIDPGQTADIDIKNGAGFTLTLTDFQFATNAPSAVMLVPGVQGPVSRFTLNVNSLRIQVKGIKFGSPILFAQNASFGPAFTEKLVVNVRDTRTGFNPTVPHRHEPVKEPDEWNKVCEEAEKEKDLGFTLKQLAKAKASPETVVGFARLRLAGKPLANKHFEHYLTGAGATVNEDEHIKDWIKGDDNARKVIAKRIKNAKKANEDKTHVMFRFEQAFFDGNTDAKFSFGAIDNLEAEANFVMGTVDVWFEDTYEWHPPYSQYTKPQLCPDIGKDESTRDTHFGHAALVQMKTRGAKDFQMRGRATFDIKLFPGL